MTSPSNLLDCILDTSDLDPAFRLQALSDHVNGGAITGRDDLLFKPVSSSNENVTTMESADAHQLSLSVTTTSGYRTETHVGKNAPPDSAPLITMGLVTEGQAEFFSSRGSFALTTGGIYINGLAEFRADWGPGSFSRINFPVESFEKPFLLPDEVFILSERHPVNRVIRSVFDSLETVLRDPSIGSSEELSSIARTLIQTVVTSGNRDVDNSRYNLIRVQARDFVARNLHEADLDIDAIASHVNASRATLYRAFADEGGVMDWVRTERLRAAGRTLKCERPHRGLVEKVARDCGFTSARHFGRIFKHHFGRSPVEFNRLSFQGRPDAAGNSDESPHRR